MINKDCINNRDKRSSLPNMDKSEHSKKSRFINSFIIFSTLKNLILKLFLISYLIGENTLKIWYKLKYNFDEHIKYNINKYYRFLRIKFRKLIFTIKHYFVNIKNEIKDPYIKVYNKYQNVKCEYEKNDNSLSGIKCLIITLRQAIRNNRKIIFKLLNYIYPAIGLSILIITISMINSFEYGLSVNCLGKHIGYIENEYVFLDASKQMNSRINYSEDQIPINDSPIYTLVKLNKDIKCDMKDSLADKLLKASNNLVCQATGLYINDNFIGAVKNKHKLHHIVNGLLQPYKDLYPDDEVCFVDDISIKDGYYLTNSLCKLSAINEKLTSRVEDQIVYTVQKGDVPLLIAVKNSVPYNQLKQLNPDIEQDLKPGKQIVVSQSKPLLSVQVTQLKSENEEIPFEIEKKEDANIPNTFCKVIQQGRKGIIEKEYKTTIIDGVEVSCDMISEKTIMQPVTQKWLIGTKSMTTNLQPYSNNKNSNVKCTILFPIEGGRISCGWYGYKGHTGIDICAPKGTIIRASANGKVIFSGCKGAYGNYVLISHGNGLTTRYAHNSENLVSVGENVVAGQAIAKVGQTGNARGNHCHYEVMINNVHYNPMNYINR